MRAEKIYDYKGSNYNFYDINFIILRRAMRNNKKILLLFFKNVTPSWKKFWRELILAHKHKIECDKCFFIQK